MIGKFKKMMFYQLVKSDPDLDKQIVDFIKEESDFMFGAKQFKFGIGAKINECYASIYHDEVKDGPMRRMAVTKAKSKEGLVSKPTWRSIISKLADEHQHGLYILRHDKGQPHFCLAFDLTIPKPGDSEQCMTFKCKDQDIERTWNITKSNIVYIKRKLKFCPEFVH